MGDDDGVMEPPEGYELYGSFWEADWRIVAWLPSSYEVAREWILRASRGEVIVERRVRMDYEPRFGPDVSDVDRLEHETEALLQEVSRSAPSEEH